MKNWKKIIGISSIVLFLLSFMFLLISTFEAIGLHTSFYPLQFGTFSTLIGFIFAYWSLTVFAWSFGLCFFSWWFKEEEETETKG
jgi:hypothetical protein